MLKHGLHTRNASARRANSNPVKVVKVPRSKNRTCKPLMANAVKPSQSKSHQLAGLTDKALADGRRADGAGCHPRQKIEATIWSGGKTADKTE